MGGITVDYFTFCSNVVPWISSGRCRPSCGSSRPTVVRTLAALARDLGVSLLKRTTRRIHLTDEGSHYLVRCRDILAATQEAEALLTASRTEPVGRLSVTAS